MILVDTNILIDFFNSPNQPQIDIFLKNDVAVCGVVQAELIHGSKSDSQAEEIKLMLTGLEYLETQKSDWIEIGLFLLKLRRNGLAVPFPDAVIAYLGIKNNCEIWTRDNHFKLIKAIVPELKLFNPA